MHTFCFRSRENILQLVFFFINIYIYFLYTFIYLLFIHKIYLYIQSFPSFTQQVLGAAVPLREGAPEKVVPAAEVPFLHGGARGPLQQRTGTGRAVTHPEGAFVRYFGSMIFRRRTVHRKKKC